MFQMNNQFMNRFFRKVDGMVWDMMTGKLGYQQQDGIITLDLNADDPEMSQPVLNPFDEFGVAIPAFAQSTAVDQVNIGDIIYSSASNRVMGWIVKKSDKQFRVMRVDGTTSTWNPPKVQMIGFDTGVMVLRSLMTMMPGGQMGQMQSMLMPMMAMGMGSDLEDMIPLMLMGGMQGSTDGNNMGQMMQTMMMMKMMGGMSMSNPTKVIQSHKGQGDNILSKLVSDSDISGRPNGFFDNIQNRRR